MMKFRQGLTSRERKKERNMIGEEYKGNFNYICNTVFLKLTAVNLEERHHTKYLSLAPLSARLKRHHGFCLIHDEHFPSLS